MEEASPTGEGNVRDHARGGRFLPIHKEGFT